MTPAEWCAAHGHSKANLNACLACGAILNREAVPHREAQPQEKKTKKK